MIFNKKAVTTVQGILLIVIIVIVLAVAAFVLGSTPQAPANPNITVYIDTVKQTGNYTEPQTLNWGTISALNTYTKNFTIVNSGTQTYNILLLTTEPAGTTQTWPYNNTALGPSTFSAGTLALTLSATPSGGAYTWRLIASNGTLPTATPTVNPSASPIPNSLNITISADSNVESILMSKNNAANYTITSPNQRVIPLTAGDDLKLYPIFVSGYTLNGWLFQDGSISTASTLTLQNINANVEVTCESKLAPTA